MRLAARASPLVAATPPRRAPHAGGSAAPHARGRRCAPPPRAGAGGGRPDPRKPARRADDEVPDRVQRVTVTGPSDEAAAVAAALRRIDGRPDVRPVDPAEAARGRLDFAQVDSWSAKAVQKAAKAGAQGSAALDALPLQSFVPDTALADESRPFYEQLALRLQALEARGELAAAGAAALPSFREWKLGRAAYVAYLADVVALHSALEAAAPASPPLLAWLGAAGGLARAAAASADLRALTTGDEAFAAAPPAPSPTAAAHAARIATLAAAAQSDAASAARCAAHGYALHVAHVSLGMRIGAKGAEQLGLAQRTALRLYSDFPGLPAKATPLAALARSVDALGAALRTIDTESGAEGRGGERARDAFLDELAPAVRATSALWAGLAGTPPS